MPKWCKKLVEKVKKMTNELVKNFIRKIVKQRGTRDANTSAVLDLFLELKNSGSPRLSMEWMLW